MKKIRVLNSYDVFVGIGVIDKLPQLTSVKKYSKVFVITTPKVDKFCFSKLKEVLSNIEKIVVDIDEKTKNIEKVQTIWEELFLKGCDRKSLVIILGGGVLGDLAGFAASTFMRGVDFIQVPTTLLSQVDSSIGGKNGLNFKGVKNLIGTFDRQVAVICDINFLDSLPDRQFTEGFGEIIKHGVVADKSYFDFVTSKKPRDFSKDELAKIILESIKIKAKIVNSDEKEQGPRKLINFGHTIGHAVEALSQNTNHPLFHGEAVSIGMVIEAKISQALGLISEEKVKQIKKALEIAGLPTNMPDFSFKNLMEKIKADKKSEAGEIKFTLLEEIGKGIIKQNVSEDIIKKAIL